MGEIADQIIDQILEGQGYWKKPRKNATNPEKQKARSTNFQDLGKGIWRSNDGPVAISEMTDFHISNCILICVRYGNTTKLAELQKELDRRDALGPKEIPF